MSEQSAYEDWIDSIAGQGHFMTSRDAWNACAREAVKRIRAEGDAGILRLRGTDEAVRIVESLLEEGE